MSAALGEHRPARVLGAHVVGRVPADEQIDLVLGLRLTDRAGLERLMARQADPSSADFRRYVTPRQFAERFAPSASAYEELASVLEEAGLQITRRTDGRGTMSVRGPAAAIERLFDTQLDLYEDRRGVAARFRAPSERFAIPPALAGLVEHVVGLDDANRYRAHFAGPPPGASPNALPGSADPADLRNLYGVPTAVHPVTLQPLRGAGETVAILGTGYGPDDTDIAGFIGKFSPSTSAAAQYAQVLLGGPNRDPVALANNEYGENVLDIDMVWALAPLANVVHILTASNGSGLFSDGIAFIVNQVPQAHAVTVSYGTCERVAISEVLVLNSLFMQAKAGGQAWFIASGDNGTDGCQDGSTTGVLSVDWPASSPYVFGVGGTQIKSGVEQAWFSGGGGFGENLSEAQLAARPRAVPRRGRSLRARRLGARRGSERVGGLRHLGRARPGHERGGADVGRSLGAGRRGARQHGHERLPRAHLRARQAPHRRVPRHHDRDQLQRHHAGLYGGGRVRYRDRLGRPRRRAARRRPAMNALHSTRGPRILVAALVLSALGACRDSGLDGGADAAPDLALPPQVTHIGVEATACCIETTSRAWRVLYLASPQPGGSDARGRDIATKGELHLADAYGTDITLASAVPRNGYQFSPDGRFVFFLAPSANKDKTYCLKIAAVAADTLGAIDPITVIPRGLDDKPLSYQSFYSPTGKYLIIGVAPKGVAYSTDLSVVEIETARVLFTLPDGSFNYIENVTSSDVLIYQNSTASKVVGVPSSVGLYALPIGAAEGGGVPALIDSRTVSFSLTGDERRVIYSRYDGTVWLYDLYDKSRVQLASGVVNFTVGSAINGPLVWVGKDLAVHVTPLLQTELVATPPGATDEFSSFLFSPSAQDSSSSITPRTKIRTAISTGSTSARARCPTNRS